MNSEKIKKLVNEKEYQGAIEEVKTELSGIDWNADATGPVAERDGDLYGLINTIHYVRTCGADTAHLRTIDLRLLSLSGDEVAAAELEAVIHQIAVIAEAELEIL